ncbi:MAG TPA: HyaD/HybD family hydrogenase maturation endopeptidase [Casimicrobiaceae bacterium]
MGIVVLGIGNLLLGDEGCGVHALHALRAESARCGPDVTFVDGGTLSFDLCAIVEATDALIVLDAANLGASPGSVRCLEGRALDRFLETGVLASVHEVALADVLAIAELNGRLPARRALVGVQPQRFDLGIALTDGVAGAIPRMCDEARRLLKRWRTEPPSAAAQATHTDGSPDGAKHVPVQEETR